MEYLMENKTITYLSGRFFDGISSGLFMMALPWIMLQQPDMGTFVALIALFLYWLILLLNPSFFSPYRQTLSEKHSNPRSNHSSAYCRYRLYHLLVRYRVQWVARLITGNFLAIQQRRLGIQ